VHLLSLTFDPFADFIPYIAAKNFFLPIFNFVWGKLIKSFFFRGSKVGLMIVSWRTIITRSLVTLYTMQLLSYSALLVVNIYILKIRWWVGTVYRCQHVTIWYTGWFFYDFQLCWKVAFSFIFLLSFIIICCFIRSVDAFCVRVINTIKVMNGSTHNTPKRAGRVLWMYSN